MKTSIQVREINSGDLVGEVVTVSNLSNIDMCNIAIHILGCRHESFYYMVVQRDGEILHKIAMDSLSVINYYKSSN